MTLRRMIAMVVLTAAAAATALPANAVVHKHRHGAHTLTVSRTRGLAVPADPVVLATPNFTGENGVTTDVKVFPDLAVGDGFPGTQTPGLNSYGLNGAALYTPYQLR